jgi:hypothetical protein
MVRLSRWIGASWWIRCAGADLEAAGYITRTRTGRRTRYTVNRDSLFRHSAQEGHRVGPFLALLTASGDASAPPEHGDQTQPG